MIVDTDVLIDAGRSVNEAITCEENTPALWPQDYYYEEKASEYYGSGDSLCEGA